MGLYNQKLALLLSAAALCIALSGCSTTTQTSSGKDYLRAYAQDAGPRAAPMDADVKAAASVEPLLRFPARIGLARIGTVDRWQGPQLTNIPSSEAAAWQSVAKNLGPSFGEFVPVSPLVAEMFEDRDKDRRNVGAGEVVRMIRLGAARQHLDAVIVYESDGTANASKNPLAIADWTLIGLFVLPSRDVNAYGVAQAMLIDVRNGYPYGTTQAEASDAAITVQVAKDEAERDLAEAARLSAVKLLAPQVEKMMRDLRTELAEKRERRRAQR